MKITIRNILAVVIGLLIGSMVNMGLIMISSSIIALPAGVDATNVESIKASIHLFEPKHFIFPFLAHALGTLVGAFIAAKIAASRHLMMGFLVGVFFMAGGIANIYMMSSPMWFNVVDLVFAYLPMAWIGAKLAIK